MLSLETLVLCFLQMPESEDGMLIEGVTDILGKTTIELAKSNIENERLGVNIVAHDRRRQQSG